MKLISLIRRCRSQPTDRRVGRLSALTPGKSAFVGRRAGKHVPPIFRPSIFVFDAVGAAFRMGQWTDGRIDYLLKGWFFGGGDLGLKPLKALAFWRPPKKAKRENMRWRIHKFGRSCDYDEYNDNDQNWGCVTLEE